jgi:ribosomal protein S18 acetylase RimI-like enzyme
MERMSGMITIKTLEEFTIDDQRSFGTNGYVSGGRYVAVKKESTRMTSITLKLAKFEKPFTKVWSHIDADFERYGRILPLGNSLGAYDGEKLVGVLIAEPRSWNNTLWIENIAVSESYRRKGIGSLLMKSIEKIARERGNRVIALETQNTNLPAITFYRKNGFEIDGVDLSYYTNTDLVDGEVALFMKKKLAKTS